MVIVGMGVHPDGKSYFLFYDNATTDPKVGASLENKLYCYCEESILEGENDKGNAYIQLSTGRKKYTISRIITSIKI